MTRIKALDRDDVGPEVQSIYDRDERVFGIVLNPTRVFAYRPPILAASKALNRSVSQDATVPESLRSLVCLRVAMLVGCPF